MITNSKTTYAAKVLKSASREAMASIDLISYNKTKYLREIDQIMSFNPDNMMLSSPGITQIVVLVIQEQINKTITATSGKEHNSV